MLTGAGPGSGAACVRLFAQHGRPLLLLGRRFERLKALGPPRTLYKAVDVTDRAAFTPAVREAEDAYGPTDVLVNHAGVMLTGDPVTRDPAERDRMTVIAPGDAATEPGSHITGPEVKESRQAAETAPERVLTADDDAEAIRYACRRPRNVRVREIVPADTGRPV
ncbi:SDR family NAD(P)-dependent oxidoreductase [Streptomyces sp. NPDC051173]|uniref:SDR family oxidoreductase n=1 Tax=Streptomyces sp. NPDC051173 TaxID=3155164 RepID=UPI00344E3C87